MSSPRAWGCFPGVVPPRHLSHVFPTCVGVFLGQKDIKNGKESLPHVRGGVSKGHLDEAKGHESSPRAWGCFPDDVLLNGQQAVFPTCVGVFPALKYPGGKVKSLPHVRGGVSGSLFIFSGLRTSSPRAWGCFFCVPCLLYLSAVFPTCVGVFPGR